MSKVAVVYWSGSGNTEEMAKAVVEGAKEKGAEVVLVHCSDFSAADVAAYDAIAFGCPAMGAEVLEESEFQPMFDEVSKVLGGKKIALFGSYGWGDGQWMRDWEDRMVSAGATLVGGEGVICQEAPDEAALQNCIEIGKQLVNA